MTVVLAIAFLVCVGFSLLPGSNYRHEHDFKDFKWDGPHIYVNLAATCFAVALAISVLS